MTDVRFAGGRRGTLVGSCSVPTDKSITQRALLLGAVACGSTRITRPLDSEDARSTRGAIEQLGAQVKTVDDGLVVTGVGSPQAFRAADQPLDLGNSGTGVRLLLGLLAGAGVKATLMGDASLSARPMGRVVEPLRAMGVAFDGPATTLPLRLRGGSPCRPFVGTTQVVSAQVKSALLLAGLSATGTTHLREQQPTRDHTERMLRAFGVDVAIGSDGILFDGPATLTATDVDVPSDPSSAAPLAAAAAIVPGSRLVLEGVLDEPRRTAFFDVLADFGARVTRSATEVRGGTRRSTFTVESDRLQGVHLDRTRVPDLIDELPLVAALGALADGVTVVEDAAELRVKESDRIAAMAAGLRALGATFEEREDGFRVRGGSLRGSDRGGIVLDPRHDHRIAMALGVAAMAAEGSSTLTGAECVAVSFPRFFETLAGAGASDAFLGIP